MSTPVKHHFLPKFYLERWVSPAEGGKVVAFTRPRRQLVVKSHFPAAIGYQEHLYAVPSRDDPKERQALESRFMAPLDDAAARALSFIESEKRRPDDTKLVSGWSRFLMSLLYRTPERLGWLEAKLRENDDAVMEKIRLFYQARRGPDDPLTFEEYRDRGDGGLIKETRAVLLRKLIDNMKIGEHLNNMPWTLITPPAGTHRFLTSDAPIMMSNGIGLADSFIMLPISPHTLFLATNSGHVRAAFAAQEPKAFVRAMNDAVVRQADKLVIGSTRNHARFVDKRLGTGGPSSTDGLFRRITWRAPI